MSDVYQAPEAELTHHKVVTEYGSIAKGIAGDYEFDIGQVLNEAWQKTPGTKWRFHIAAGIYFLVYLVVVFATSFLTVAVFGSESSSPTLLALVNILTSLVTIAVTMPVWGGLFMMGIKRAVDEPFSGTEPLNWYHKTLPLLGMLLLMYLLLFIGFLLLILPGIYLSFAYMMAIPLLLEKDLSPWQALEVSRKTITRKWFKFFGFFLLSMIILLVASIPLFLGLIWVYPWLMIAIGIIYRNMFGYGQEQA